MDYKIFYVSHTFFRLLHQADLTNIQYYENGILKKVTNYSFGKRNGLEENFDQNGEIIDSRNWRSGKLEE